MKTLSEHEFQEALEKAMSVAEKGSVKKKLAFSASITESNWLGVGCETEWGQDVSDAELVSAFVSLLDDIRQDSHIEYLFGKAIGVSDEMRNYGIDSYTFAERREEDELKNNLPL